MQIKIKGGNKLIGEVTPIPNKNAIMAGLPASILVKGKTIFKNVPKSTDVEKHLQILKYLGAVIDDHDFNNLVVDCTNITSHIVDAEVGMKFRSSIMYAGPLLARFGKARIPLPGGCTLGTRSIAAHIDIFAKCGVTVTVANDSAFFEKPQTTAPKYDLWQWEASVTATENFAMYAAGTPADFRLIDAASEPHVTRLLGFLAAMGAQVHGVGSNKLTINGVANLRSATFEPGPDHIDIAGYIVAAAVTNGNITIRNASDPEITGGLVQAFKKFNLNITAQGDALLVNRNNGLFIDTVNSGMPMAGEHLPKFLPRPWPGYPVDALPIIATLASKTKGRLLLQNWMYESGLDFVRELNNMGASIFMCDPQRVIITGPVTFTGGIVSPPAVIQAVKAVFLAALADPVETIINGVEVLNRRYPDIVENYKKLGADIEVLG